jgi:hypothetical protein
MLITPINVSLNGKVSIKYWHPSKAIKLLSFCLIKHNATKTHRKMEVQLHILLTLATDEGVGCQLQARPALFQEKTLLVAIG